MDFTNLLTAVFGVAALIGGGLAGLLYGGLRTLRDSNKDLRDRVADLEKDRAEEKTAKAELTTEVRFLRSALAGKPEWIALTDQMEEHHKASLAAWAMLAEQISELTTAVREAS